MRWVAVDATNHQWANSALSAPLLLCGDGIVFPVGLAKGCRRFGRAGLRDSGVLDGLGSSYHREDSGIEHGRRIELNDAHGIFGGRQPARDIWTSEHRCRE